jgi:hypothetical protein
MSWLVVPALVAAGLLALAGATKVVEPRMTVGALRAMGVPAGLATPGVVRLGAALELALGVLALVVGGPALWWLACASYVAFALFLVAALRSGRPIGTCGCFGREDTEPSGRHLAVDGFLAVAAAAVARGLDGAPLDQVRDHPGAGICGGLLAVLLGASAYLALTRRPGLPA